MKIAVLWDESYLWGLITYWSCKSACIPFEIILSSEIPTGILDHYDLVIVPGGWAAQKGKALGEDGRKELKHFVESGGSFLGFCGGAGLGLDVNHGLSLLPVTRKDARNRLVNFSGGVLLTRAAPDHPLWHNINSPADFYVWWPSQFELSDASGVTPVASYEDSFTDFRVSDLSVDDIKLWGIEWEEWESVYGINLDPEILWGEPAIVEGRCGRGRVVLSYVHLDTPDHRNSQAALKNLCLYLCNSPADPPELFDEAVSPPRPPDSARTDIGVIKAALRIKHRTSEFYNFGYRNLFWSWRTPWLLQWKRGLRGLEYTTLLVMSGELTRRILEKPEQHLNVCTGDWKNKFFKFEAMLESFTNEAAVLLGKERFVSEKSPGPLCKLSSPSEEVRLLRDKLFGDKMSFGGHYRELISVLDELLVSVLRAERDA